MSKPLLSKEKQKEIARGRIDKLFQQAQEVFHKNKQLADRYVHLAREIAMASKLRMPTEHKRRFCKFCYVYLMPGLNSRVRTRGGKVIVSCLECKRFMRIPIR